MHYFFPLFLRKFTFISLARSTKGHPSSLSGLYRFIIFSSLSQLLFSCSYWVFNLNNSIIDDNAMSLVFRRLYSVLCVQLVQEY